MIHGGGGYWWGIAGAAVAIFVSSYKIHSLWAVADVVSLTVLCTLVAAALGGGEAHQGKAFVSGRWVLFSVATLASSALWFAPAIAYTATFYGWRNRHRISSAVTASSRRQNRHRSPVSTNTRHAAVGGVAGVAGGFFGIDDQGQIVSANPRGAAMVIGPPGSGKTFSVIVPSVAYAPGAVVSTSIKTEVLAATVSTRAQRGRCWWFDPGGANAAVHSGVEQLRWNPLCDITDWDTARSVATRLTSPARSGAGAGMAHSGDHWVDRAEAWLAVLLYAAKLTTDGGDLAALARWCVNPTASGPDCEAILVETADTGDPGAQIAHNLLVSLLAVPDKERESIASTLSRVMNIYTSVAALSAGTDPNFDPAAFVRSTDTIYITAPVDKQRDYAPLIAGLLESIRLAQYHRRQAVDLGTETQDTPVTFVLDEAANTAPIPLPNIASEAGGQGLHLVVAFQDLSQARARWGQAADGFLTLFPEKLILSGMADEKTATMLSKISGEYDRTTTSVNQPGRSHHTSPGLLFGRYTGASRADPGISYQTTRAPVLSVADITGVPMFRGLYFHPHGWQLISLQQWRLDLMQPLICK